MKSSIPTTPVTDDVFRNLTSDEELAISDWDARRLEVEREKVASWVGMKMTSPTHSFVKMMREWERLIVAMEADWKTKIKILLDDYLYALDTRAALEEAMNELSPAPPPRVVDAVRRLDERFFAQTVAEVDSGHTGVMTSDLHAHRGRNPSWLWNRQPKNIPW